MNGEEFRPPIVEEAEKWTQETDKQKEIRIRKLIADRWFTHKTIFADDIPFLFVNSIKALSLGSISCVKGKPKAGKGWALALVVNGFLNGGIICSPLNERKQVILIDTEQTGKQAQRLMVAVKNLGGNEDKIFGVRLRGAEPDDIFAAIEVIIKDNYKKTALYILDGVIDAVNNGVNDEKEGMAFVRKLMELSDNYKVHIIGIIHENKSDTNATGFFGGYMAKKGELTFSVSKTKTKGEWLHEIEFTDARDAPIDEIYFRVKDTGNEVVPVLKTPPISPKEYDPRIEDNSTHKEKLKAIFKEGKPLTSGELIEKIKYHYGIGLPKAKSFKEHLIVIDWIVDRGSGQKREYSLVEDAPIFR